MTSVWIFERIYSHINTLMIFHGVIILTITNVNLLVEWNIFINKLAFWHQQIILVDIATGCFCFAYNSLIKGLINCVHGNLCLFIICVQQYYWRVSKRLGTRVWSPTSLILRARSFSSLTILLNNFLCFFISRYTCLGICAPIG